MLQPFGDPVSLARPTHQTAMLGGRLQQTHVHGPPSYRLRVTSLPATFANHPRHSVRQLQHDILASYGVVTLHMSHNCLNRHGDRAWAFLEVNAHDDGAYLMGAIGETKYDGEPLRLEWAHDRIPGMLAEASKVTMGRYPNLVFYQSPKFGTFKVHDLEGGGPTKGPVAQPLLPTSTSATASSTEPVWPTRSRRPLAERL